FGALTHQIAEAKSAADSLTEARATAARVEGLLASGQFAPEDRARHAAAESALAALAYDERAPAEARRLVESLAGFQPRHEALIVAETRLMSARRDLLDDEAARDRWHARHEEAVQKVTDAEQCLRELRDAVTLHDGEVKHFAEYEDR